MSNTIPKLRFQGFTGKLDKHLLSEVCSVRTGDKDTQNRVENGLYPFFVRSNTVERINTYSFDGEAILTSGDGVGVGKNFHYINGKFDFHQRVYALHNFKKGFYGTYIFHVFVEKFYKRVIRLSAKNSVDSVRMNMITEMPVYFPSLPEQQKIASFLSSVNTKIQQLTKKKELLEQYKKGVMQQLFSGKLRFKDENGNAYPNWEEKLFDDVYSFYSTNSLSRDRLNYQSGSVRNIHYGDIHTKFRSQFIANKEAIPYINQDVDLSKIKDESYCQEGDLVIADASEDYEDIGKSIEVVKLNNERVVAGLHTFLARPDLSRVSIGFSGYIIKAPYVRMQVKKIAQGTKVLSLSPSRLGKVNLHMPDKREQQKITSYLSALDAKMESVAAQIVHTQTFKKGLLQQMFV